MGVSTNLHAPSSSKSALLAKFLTKLICLTLGGLGLLSDKSINFPIKMLALPDLPPDNSSKLDIETSSHAFD